MKSIVEVREYFDTSIVSQIDVLLQEMSMLKIYAVILLLAFAIAFTSVFMNMIPLFFISFSVNVLMFYLIYTKYKGVNKIYQDCIVKPLVRYIDPHIKYNYISGISQKEFDNTHFIKYTKRKNYKSSNHVIYRNRGYTLRCAQVQTEETRVQGTQTDSTVSLYDGSVAYLTLPHSFEGRTVVYPDFAEKHLGSFGKDFLQDGVRNDLDKLRITHDKRFEKHFVVYTSNKSEARAILSKTLRDTLIRLTEQTQYGLMLSVVGNKAYVGIKMMPGFFTLSIGLSKRWEIDNFSHIEQSIKNLYVSIEALDALYSDILE